MSIKFTEQTPYYPAIYNFSFRTCFHLAPLQSISSQKLPPLAPASGPCARGLCHLHLDRDRFSSILTQKEASKQTKKPPWAPSLSPDITLFLCFPSWQRFCDYHYHYCFFTLCCLLYAWIWASVIPKPLRTTLVQMTCIVCVAPVQWWQLCSELERWRQNFLGKGNHKCKGPEIGTSLVGSRNSLFVCFLKRLMWLDHREGRVGAEKAEVCGGPITCQQKWSFSPQPSTEQVPHVYHCYH